MMLNVFVSDLLKKLNNINDITIAYADDIR